MATIADPEGAGTAVARTWPPFVLVAGLLLLGRVAATEGVFAWAAARTARLGGGERVVFVALLGVVALVSAVLNLDTAVVLLTPVLVLTARRRGTAEEPLLYGTLFMANAASLLLPGSNLTNLIVLADDPVSGATFGRQMAPVWLASVVATAAVLTVWFRRDLRRGGGGSGDEDPPRPGAVGVGATALAAGLVLVLRHPAVPVLVVALVAVILVARRHPVRWRDVLADLDLPVLAGLFGVAVALGTLAGAWPEPGRLLETSGVAATAAIGALASVAVNNLPAAVLLSTEAPAHPRALLVGLNLGPNLAVTGSLSALLWYRAARTVGARPSLWRVTAIGLVLVPCSTALALSALVLSSGPT